MSSARQQPPANGYMKRDHGMIRVTFLSGMLFAVTVQLLGQGTVYFSNRVTDIEDAPIFWIDGVTKLSGSRFMAQLYAGPTAGSLVSNGDPLPFRTGVGVGYINTVGVDPTRTIPGVAAGAYAFVQVVAWDTTTGTTYETAYIRGASGVFSLATGGGGIPPGPPALLIGLQSFVLIPEPSSFVLGLLGATVLFPRCRKFKPEVEAL